MSLRSDAWVVVVSETFGSTSVACAGRLWDPESDFPEDADYAAHEQQRRTLLCSLGLLWESRKIHLDADWRIHKLKLVWDGTARDDQTGLQKRSRHWKSKNGAKEHAQMELKEALLAQGLVWDMSRVSKL